MEIKHTSIQGPCWAALTSNDFQVETNAHPLIRYIILFKSMWDAKKYADMRASHLPPSPFFPGAPVLPIDSIYLLSIADHNIPNCMKEVTWLSYGLCNKANLRDLIAATDLVILLKLDLNLRFLSPCDLDIWWMTPKNNRAPLLGYFKLSASFRSHWWIQTGVTVQKRPIWVKFNAF